MQKKFLNKFLLLAGCSLFVFIQTSVAQIGSSVSTSLNKLSTIIKKLAARRNIQW